MALSDSNYGLIRYKTEATWAEVPGASDLIEAPITGESLRAVKDTQRSDRIRSDRMRGSSLEVGFRAEGGINFELAYGAFDQILEVMLAKDFVTASVGASVAFTGSTIVMTTAQADQFPVGMWLQTKATGISANNGVFRVMSKSGGGNVLHLNTDALTSTTVSATIQGRMLRNGTVKKSLFMEKHLTDVDDIFRYRGMRGSTMSLECQAGEKATGSIEFMGEREEYASATVASSVTAATTNDPLTGTANIGFIYEGGYEAELSTALLAISFNVTNNLRNQPKLRSKFPGGIGYGSVDVTGQINAYFEDATLYAKFHAHETTSLSFQFNDQDGNIIIFTFPRIRFTNAPVNLPGINQDVMIPLDFEAEPDPTTECVIQIDTLPATGSVA